MAAPGFFVSSSGCTASELGQLCDVDLQQLRAEANGLDVAVLNPSAHGAVVDAAPFCGFGYADKFRVPTFAAVKRCLGMVVEHGKYASRLFPSCPILAGCGYSRQGGTL